MKFLLVLLLLPALRGERWSSLARADLLCRHVIAAVSSRLGSHWLALLVLIAPAALLFWLQLAAAQRDADWLLLPLQALLLIWACGEADPRPRLQALRSSLLRGDDEAAGLYGREALAHQGHDAGSLLQHVQGFLFWHAHQSWFAVLFCLLVGGVPLAVLYRLLVLIIEQQGEGPMVRAVLLRQALDWLPVRLLGLSLALAGNFSACMRVLRTRLLDLAASPARLVVECGRAALEEEGNQPALQQLDASWNLLVRAGLIWFAVAALWVILR